ncbi:hypothetical protein F5051DRAFT_14676 [Lentinula edodes]|nr:hypothetical protein F5051DRAFT_14676 [Lentinula edodes]
MLPTMTGLRLLAIRGPLSKCLRRRILTGQQSRAPGLFSFFDSVLRSVFRGENFIPVSPIMHPRNPFIDRLKFDYLDGSENLFRKLTNFEARYAKGGHIWLSQMTAMILSRSWPAEDTSDLSKALSASSGLCRLQNLVLRGFAAPEEDLIRISSLPGLRLRYMNRV